MYVDGDYLKLAWPGHALLSLGSQGPYNPSKSLVWDGFWSSELLFPNKIAHPMSYNPYMDPSGGPNPSKTSVRDDFLTI